MPRNRSLAGLWKTVLEIEAAEEATVVSIDAGRANAADGETEALLAPSRNAVDAMHPDDREEAIGFQEDIQTALVSGDRVALHRECQALRELLFFAGRASVDPAPAPVAALISHS